MQHLEMHWWPIDRPIPYRRNSRRIPERAIRLRSGQLNAIVQKKPSFASSALYLLQFLGDLLHLSPHSK